MSVFWSILRLFVRQKYCTKGFSVVFIKKIKFKKQLPYLLKKKTTKNRYSIFKPLLLFNNYVQNDFFFFQQQTLLFQLNDRKTQFLQSNLNLKFKMYLSRQLVLDPQALGQCLAHIGNSLNLYIAYVTYSNTYKSKKKNLFSVNKASKIFDYSKRAKYQGMRFEE